MMNLPRFLKVLIFTSALFFCSANGAYAQLTITPNTWNVIGLDSNKPATDGPNEFPVGVQVCNTSSSPLSNLNTTFNWDSTNSLINLDAGGTSQTITQSSLAANTCVDVYFTVVITRNTAAYNTSRRYHVTSSATGVSTVSTPTPREVYVEKLVSQNRNSVVSITGPTTVYVGQTYNYTVDGSTATNGYEQLEAFLNLSNVIFRVLSVNTTYSVPVGATNNKIYADSCGWDNNPSSATYRSCLSTGKAGGTLKTVYTVLVLSAGTTTASTLIYDFSGSSYHYNSDFGTAISSINITSLPGGSISGTVFNDTNGLTDSTVNGTGTNAGGTVYANLLNSSNVVVQTVAVAANGTYSFVGLNAGNYTVQISTNQGAVNSAAPATALPAGWINTGENLGAAAGNDGTANCSLAVTVGSSAVTNANFGIQQPPTASNKTAPEQMNFGGTTNATVPADTFVAGDTAPGTVTGIRICAFPSNATSITINGTQFTSSNFPVGGVTVPAGTNGNPTQPILVDPVDGQVTVNILFVSIDNAGAESTGATASVPFVVVTTAATAGISGRLSMGTLPVGKTIIVLTDLETNHKTIARTDEQGTFRFAGKTVGKSYIVQPLSSKFDFYPKTRIVNLLNDETDLDFSSAPKKYHAKNDFDGDGKSDLAVYRPSEGNWYILNSGDDQMSVFNFGLNTDVPVSADFDGDGKTDYAVFRPSEGNWYIWQTKTQEMRVENFGLAGDRLVPADFDGDGKADVAVYRQGTWFIRRSSDYSYEVRKFGLEKDVPVTEDFDGDGRADLAVYRPSDGNWYILRSGTNQFSAQRFGLATDAPVSADFDGDGFADIAQFRGGEWYVLNSTTDFEAGLFGQKDDVSVVGDYDGDGRADQTVFRKGFWSIRNSGDGKARNISFGLPSDVVIK